MLALCCLLKLVAVPYYFPATFRSVELRVVTRYPRRWGRGRWLTVGGAGTVSCSRRYGSCADLADCCQTSHCHNTATSQDQQGNIATCCCCTTVTGKQPTVQGALKFIQHARIKHNTREITLYTTPRRHKLLLRNILHYRTINSCG